MTDTTAIEVALVSTKDASSTSSLKSENNVLDQSADSSVSSYGASAMPEDKKEEYLDSLQLEDDWESDPENPRNWTACKKWFSMSLVRWIISGSLRTHQPFL